MLSRSSIYQSEMRCVVVDVVDQKGEFKRYFRINILYFNCICNDVSSANMLSHAERHVEVSNTDHVNCVHERTFFKAELDSCYETKPSIVHWKIVQKNTTRVLYSYKLKPVHGYTSLGVNSELTCGVSFKLNKRKSCSVVECNKVPVLYSSISISWSYLKPS